MNKTQAFKALLSGVNVVLEMKYYAREESRIFRAEYYGRPARRVAFDHVLKCERQDFIDSATFYGGNKSDCRFTWREAGELDTPERIPEAG